MEIKHNRCSQTQFKALVARYREQCQVGVHAASVVVPHKRDAERNVHSLTFFIRRKSSSDFFLLLKLGENVDLSKEPSVLL